MCEYIGLDVSLKETAISVRRDGKRVWRGKCPSVPSAITEVLRRHAPAAQRIVFETGPLSVWFFHALSAEGLPAIRIDARHAKAALDMAPNKTDANDADGLAHLAEVGFYREVRVKWFDSMLTRTLTAARTRLVRIATELSNQIRGLMKAFGLVVPRTKGGRFEEQVRRLLSGREDLTRILLPVPETWRCVRARAADVTRQVLERVAHNRPPPAAANALCVANAASRRPVWTLIPFSAKRSSRCPAERRLPTADVDPGHRRNHLDRIRGRH